MISIEHVSMEFSARPLLQDVSFVVDSRDRIALVGKNGAGKTTLLRLIAGELQPTEGQVTRSHDTRIAYLPQVLNLTDDRTVMQEILPDKTGKASATDAMGGTPATGEEWEQEVEQIKLRAEAERALTGLGFRREDFDRPTSEFSGGWRMRIELAKLLLQKPTLLLLDEPTNHLDLGSIQWLEQYLLQKPIALLLVSHDRAFINHVTNRTIEISCGRIADYKVRYNEFEKLREERREQQLRAYENQQKLIAETKDFIERFRYKPTKSNQVQSRVKMLEKIIPIEVDEVDTSRLHLRFPPCQRSGDFPLICEDVGKTYGTHTVFSHVNLSIRRGEKVAFVGNNGEGKTTLVKCIMGETDHEGKLTLAQNVQMGYFAQNQAQLLDGSVTVFDTIDRVARGEMRGKIRDLLGAFMFGGEASDKFVRVLSGGERSRLAMIRLLLEPVNFLILDEPTNHLDMASKDVLKQAVQQFDGTAIIVSHDRDFLDGLAHRTFEFKDGQVREYLGGIYEYLKQRESTHGEHIAQSQPTTQATPLPSDARSQYEDRKEMQRQLRRAEKAVAEAEQTVERKEAELAEVERKLATPQGAGDATLCSRYAQLKRDIDQSMETWEQAEQALASLQNPQT